MVVDRPQRCLFLSQNFTDCIGRHTQSIYFSQVTIHTPRYRRFACILADTEARLAVEVVVSLLPTVGLSPTTLHQSDWRTPAWRSNIMLTQMNTPNPSAVGRISCVMKTGYLVLGGHPGR